MKRVPGLTLLVVATAVAGMAGYFITWLVPRVIGFSAYAVYAVFWSFLFLVVSMLSGVQQEITRATRAVGTSTEGRRARAHVFAFTLAGAFFVLVVLSAPLWVERAFPTIGWPFVWPLAVGSSSYILVAVIAGSLYGAAEWYPLFWMITVDALLRLIGLSLALPFTADIVVLAWVVAVPFPASVLLLWPWIRRVLIGRTELDVGLNQLLWNVVRTVAAAGSMGLMVSGFPFLLELTSASVFGAEMGLLVLAITLTRAPLIVVAMALQSFLVIFFHERRQALIFSLLRVIGLIVGAGTILAILAWVLGPAVFEVLFPAEPVPEGWLLAVLVVSSAFVAALCVSGPALLSLARHGVYSAGWLSAAVATIACVALPFGLTTRCVISLLAGPLAGLFVHIVFLLRPSLRRVEWSSSRLPGS